MKRDLDLIRKILLKIESCDNPDGIFNTTDINIEGYRAELIQYQVGLLVDAGLVTSSGKPARFMDASFISYFSVNLTWTGSELLDNAKNESVWQTVKKDLRSKWDSVSFSALQTLLDQAALKILDAQ